MQGVDGWDVDLPTPMEANLVNNFVSKAVWVFWYIVIYGVRPLLIRPKSVGEPHLPSPSRQCIEAKGLLLRQTLITANSQITCWHAGVADIVNIVAVLGFDAVVLYFCGIKAMAYLLFGNVFGGGLHPMAGHLIAEHYMFAKASLLPLSLKSQHLAWPLTPFGNAILCSATGRMFPNMAGCCPSNPSISEPLNAIGQCGSVLYSHQKGKLAEMVGSECVTNDGAGAGDVLVLRPPERAHLQRGVPQ